MLATVAEGPKWYCSQAGKVVVELTGGISGQAIAVQVSGVRDSNSQCLAGFHWARLRIGRRETSLNTALSKVVAALEILIPSFVTFRTRFAHFTFTCLTSGTIHP